VKKKILIYDDDERFVNELKERLTKLPIVRETFEVEVLSHFKDSMEILQDRRKLHREGREWNDEPKSFDDVSIFIIDFDLFKSEEKFLTGEFVAYLARCFSKCGLIVGVNQYGHNTFDLTLRGHPESFADLNVGQAQLNNPDLWRSAWGGARRGFRPWYWPSLPDYLCDLESRVDDVRNSLDSENPNKDKPICEVIGFDPELFELLPRSISQFLGRESAATTFRQFVTESGNCLKPKDAQSVNDEILARVGAARISKWLERFVLPEQDILVDAPHLVSRYPSLMVGDITKTETWNQTAQLTNYKQLGLDTEPIESFRLKKDYWLSRPVWFWDKLRECEKIPEVGEPWKRVSLNCVFCEDASRFYEDRMCKEFLAETESPFSRRFVRHFKKVDYRPRVRLSL